MMFCLKAVLYLTTDSYFDIYHGKKEKENTVYSFGTEGWFFQNFPKYSNSTQTCLPLPQWIMDYFTPCV